MSGMTDYTAENYLAYIAGRANFPSLIAGGIFLALFTTAPTSDAGVTGAVEVSGGGYARVQVAGSAATSAATATGSTLTFASVPSWVTVGMAVLDITASSVIPANTTVTAKTSTTVTLSNAVTGAGVGNGDTIAFSAFGAPSPSSGSEPAVTPANITNVAAIAFAQATANWGTVTSFGLFDALTSGNLLTWDFLGNFSWLPCTISAASPGVFTSHAHGYAAADNVVFTTKFGGTQPTFSQSNLTGLLAVVSPTTDTFTVTNGGIAVNTSSTGDGQVRKVSTQSIPANITASFPASSLVANAA